MKKRIDDVQTMEETGQYLIEKYNLIEESFSIGQGDNSISFHISHCLIFEKLPLWFKGHELNKTLSIDGKEYHVKIHWKRMKPDFYIDELHHNKQATRPIFSYENEEATFWPFESPEKIEEIINTIIDDIYEEDYHMIPEKKKRVKTRPKVIKPIKKSVFKYI